MAVVIDRAKIDDMVHHMVIQVLMAKEHGQVADAQRVLGNKIADMIWDEASVKFERIDSAIQEEMEKIRCAAASTGSHLEEAILNSKRYGMDLARSIIHNTD